MRYAKFCLLSAGLLAFLTGCKSTPKQTQGSAASDTSSLMATATGPRIYVTDEVSGGLTVIDANTMKPLETVKIGTRPRGIHASPDGKTIYIALSGSPIAGPGVDESTLPPADHSKDGIGVFDIAQNKIVKILPAGNDPENFDVSPDGKKIYVSNEDDSAVSIIDVASGKLDNTLRMGAQPEGVQISHNGKFVFITSEETSTISVLNLAMNKITATFKVGHRPRNVAFTHDDKLAYVNAENDGTVTLVDVARRKVIKTIHVGKPGLVKPMDVLLSPDGNMLYASTGRGGDVVAIDTKTNSVKGKVAVGKRPWGIALSLDGKTLYSANGPSNDVSAVDLATLTVKAKAPAGGSPWGLVVLP
jgi:YVTN family beta-propeller protein